MCEGLHDDWQRRRKWVSRGEQKLLLRRTIWPLRPHHALVIIYILQIFVCWLSEHKLPSTAGKLLVSFLYFYVTDVAASTTADFIRL